MNTVVIDANISLAQVLPLPYSALADTLMQRLLRERSKIVVPLLWEYEITSGLRRACTKQLITTKKAKEGLVYLLNMHFDTLPGLPERHLLAMDWAERLGQTRAYDSQYLAIAEERGAIMYTADQRLVNGARQHGITWVHWVGEAL